MRTRAHALLIACLAAGALVAAQGPAPDAAAKVLASAREALGGDKKLAAVKTIVVTGRTKQVRGENLVLIEFEIAMELPDKYVRKDEIPAQESDPSTVGFNADELIQFPVPAIPSMPARAGGPPAPTAEQLAAGRRARLGNVKQDFARLTLGMFAASFSSFPLTFRYVGKAEAPQGKADVLDVKGPVEFLGAPLPERRHPSSDHGVTYARVNGSGLLRGLNLNAPVNGIRPNASVGNLFDVVGDASSRQHTVNTFLQVSITPPSPNPGKELWNWKRTNFGVNCNVGKLENNTDSAFGVPATGSLAAEWGTGVERRAPPAERVLRHAGAPKL